MLKNTRIGTRLLIIGVLLVAVPLIVVTAFAVTRSGSALTQEGVAGLRREARFVATGINQTFQGVEAIVQDEASRSATVAAARSVASGGATQDEVAAAVKVLSNYASNNTLEYTTDGFLLVDANGRVFGSTVPSLVGESVASSGYFKSALAGNPVAGLAATDKSGNQYVPVAAPIFSVNGSQVFGVLVDRLPLKYVSSLVANISVGKTGYAFVIDRNGLVLAAPDNGLVMTQNVMKTKDLESLGKAMISGNNGTLSYVQGGAERLAGYAPVTLPGWSVAITVRRSAYLAPVAMFRILALIVTAFAVFLAITILLVFVRSITQPLRRAVNYAKVVASGDLTQRLELKRRDEVGMLTRALDEMVDWLHGMILKIRDAASQTATSSQEMSAGAQQLAEGAQNQASTLEETSASVEELTASVEQVSGHAHSQAESVERSSGHVVQMRQSVDRLAMTLNEVAQSVEDSARAATAGMHSVAQVVEAITSISGSSTKIVGIVNVIGDIADQTNLLSLNAAIEAARAGEHGRGFAVVADEVSKLADRSAASSKEIAALIAQSTNNVNQGVKIAESAREAMNEIICRAQRANELVAVLSQDIERQVTGFGEIAKASESINEMSHNISAATEKQSLNARQVAKAIENVNDLTQQAAGGAEEMSAATEELSTLAEELQRLVEQFKLGESVDARGPLETILAEEEPGIEAGLVSPERQAMVGDRDAADSAPRSDAEMEQA